MVTRYHIIIAVYEQHGEINTWIDGQLIRERMEWRQLERVRMKLFRAVWDGEATWMGTQMGSSFGFMPY